VGQGDLLLRREQFAVDKLDYCLEQLSKPDFAEHIRTDTTTVSGVTDRIAETAGLTLAPNTDGRLRGRLRRIGVTIRQRECERLHSQRCAPRELVRICPHRMATIIDC
jgi:hypothetical protein